MSTFTSNDEDPGAARYDAKASADKECGGASRRRRPRPLTQRPRATALERESFSRGLHVEGTRRCLYTQAWVRIFSKRMTSTPDLNA